MSRLKQTFHPIYFIVLAFCLVVFPGCACDKDRTDYECLICTAKYNTGMIAGQHEACGGEAQRKFRDEFRYVEDAGGKIECK